VATIQSSTGLPATKAAGIFSRARIFEILEVAKPDDRTSRLVDKVLVALIVVSVVGIVLESVAGLSSRYSTVFDWLRWASVIIFSGEYLLRVWSCPESDDERFQAPITGRLAYMFTPMALVDVLAFAPFYLSMFFIVDLRFLRILRLLRLLKLARYSPVLSILAAIVRAEKASICTTLFFLMMVLIFAATGIYYFEHKAQPVAFAHIPAAMWWAVATITTVGYGDVTPITPLGKVFAAMVSIVGVSMIAVPAGLMASRLTDELRRRRENYQALVEENLEDGIITDDESRAMELKREKLGISEHDAAAIARHALRELRQTSSCPHCGKQIEG